MYSKACKTFYGKGKKTKDKLDNSIVKQPEDTFSSEHTRENIDLIEKTQPSRYPLVIEFRGLGGIGQLGPREICIDVDNFVIHSTNEYKNIFVLGLARKTADSRRSILTKIVRHVSPFSKIIVILPETHAGNLTYSIQGNLIECKCLFAHSVCAIFGSNAHSVCANFGLNAHSPYYKITLLK